MTQVSRKGFVDKNGQQVVIVPKVPGATADNFASFNEEGNLQDSGKKPANFAPAGHSHSAIIDTSSESNISIDEGTISIVIEGEGSGGETQINANNIGNLHRALATPSSAPEDDATKLITSKAVYDALLAMVANLRRMRITYDRVEEEFVVSESDEAVLVTFRNSAPADTFVPVLVSLYEGDTKDSDLFGLAKWSEEQQPNFTYINILVVIGKYYFSVEGSYQDIDDIRFSRWTRTVKGQSFFS